MYYIFGYYIFGSAVPTENVITENVINSSDNFYFEKNIAFCFSRSVCVDNSYITASVQQMFVIRQCKILLKIALPLSYILLMSDFF